MDIFEGKFGVVAQNLLGKLLAFIEVVNNKFISILFFLGKFGPGRQLTAVFALSTLEIVGFLHCLLNFIEVLAFLFFVLFLKQKRLQLYQNRLYSVP